MLAGRGIRNAGADRKLQPHDCKRSSSLMAELEHKQRALRQTEIEALTHQINPHFLYNTLDTIVWLAEFKDNEKDYRAHQVAGASSSGCRLPRAKPWFPSSDEAEHARQYLYIQQERYGDR